jgi:MoaA/NifB/PqqE/SkfB family radical SAM enzyme
MNGPTLTADPPREGTPQVERSFRRTTLPAPQPDLFAYRLNRFLALATSPRRLLNYIKYRCARRTPHLNYLPIRLDIENVSRCNFHCTMCQVSDWTKYKRADDMSLEDFKRLIDEQYGLLEVKVQGIGEPLLGKSYFEMLRYARSKRIWVRTTTNASLLHLKESYKQLVDSGVNDIQISIDGATKTTFEKIRRGSRFESVRENCKLINGYCRERGVERTRMWVCLQQDNIHEYFDFIPFADELGFRRVTYALNLNDWGQAKWNSTIRSLTIEERVTPSMTEEAMARGRKLGVEVTFWNNTARYSTAAPAHVCPWPFERAYVSSDMRIVPCCILGNPDVSELGDAHAFTTQWRGEAYRDFRAAHLEGRIPKVCQGCYERPEKPA